MRHEITKITEHGDIRTYKVLLWVSPEYKWADQVKLHVWKFSEHKTHDMKPISDSDGEKEYILFETTLELEYCPLTHYYFSFYTEVGEQYYMRKEFAKTSII